MSTEKKFNRSLTGKELFKKALVYKSLYIATFVLFVGIAFLNNKYSKTIYQAKASILLNPNSKGAILGSNDMFKGLEALQSSKNIENEIGLLKSFSLVASTVSQLNLEVSYKLESKSFIKKDVDIYLDFPFRIIMDKSHIQPVGVRFYIDLVNDSTYRLHAEGKDVYFYNFIDNRTVGFTHEYKLDKTCPIGKTYTDKDCKFDVIIDNVDNYNLYKWGYKFYFAFNAFDYLVQFYRNSLKIEEQSSLASIINISLTGENAHKVTDVVNKFIGFYLDNNLEKKNKIAESTVKFIDSQLSDISDSLHSAESTLRNYKTENQVMDLSFQGKSIFDKLSALETEKANLMIQKRYYDYIIDYFNKNKNGSDIAPPSTMNVMDPILNKLIGDIIGLSADRANLPSSNQNNLFLTQIDNQIKQKKDAILENVRNNLATLNISLNEISYRSNVLSGEISKLPKTELQLGNIERKFKLNDEIYTFLLEKRSEAQILKSSNTPDSEVIDYSRESLAGVVSPKKNLNYFIAVLLALLLPTGFVVIKDYFNDKVIDTTDIERITNAAIIGTIFKNRHRSQTVVADFPKTSVAESFRSVRTNIQIKAGGISPQVILVSSSTSGEGKSFVSLNMAISFASFGSKVVLVGFDLRRPVLHEKLEMQNMVGLSSYLTNRAVIDDILIKTKYGVDFIPSGPILPNPSEILNNARLDKIFITLKEIYDYIIIDTAPLGPVADTFLLMRFATENIIVTRQNKTSKDTFIEVLKRLKNNNVQNVNILLNDFNVKKSSNGYDYKYYGNEGIQKSNFRSFFGKNKKVNHSKALS
ncbi:MAG TPA: polysaccharide biosynthesis tyrosine autokinase [Bacteroidales bacterium]